MSEETTPVVVLVDDLRRFRDDRPALVARTSATGLALLRSLHGTRIAELWLDHDLGTLDGTEDGPHDVIAPVVNELEERAFWGEPYQIGIIFVHTSNSTGGDAMTMGLKARGYCVQRVFAGDQLIQD